MEWTDGLVLTYCALSALHYNVQHLSIRFNEWAERVELYLLMMPFLLIGFDEKHSMQCAYRRNDKDAGIITDSCLTNKV